MSSGSSASHHDDPRHQHTLTGDIRLHRHFHSRFLKARDVIVYLPPQYEEEQQRRFPVLYLQDGQNLFDGATSFIPGREWQCDETAQRLITANKIEPLIIVGIYNTGESRADEYTPTRVAKLKAGGKADQYGRLIVEELKPFIDEQYRTLNEAENTGLGGASLGGLVSLHLGLSYPQVFGKLAIMSPSVWWDNGVILREVEQLSHKTAQRIWLDAGTKEGGMMVHNARLLCEALTVKGWQRGVDLHYHEARGAGHDETSWGRRFDRVLKFLFPRRRRS
ncbi:MAG TPA: alpha/beta hydrolase-fold protein [Blastocatellia bacterium]|nr:alpha/beta hydrolase-fold protein [Blastocatellia bacterium]